jgi:SAM-dependent methyltransferase
MVADGYDAIVDRYLEWAASGEGDPGAAWLERFAEAVPAGGSVVDLGCGAGSEQTRWLASRYRLTGVDVSEGQLERARALVPDARFIQADMTLVEFDAASLDGVMAMHSIDHVPRDLHANLFERIARWLRPGGHFVGTLNADDDPGWTGEWLGVQMFFSGFDAETNLRLLGESGLQPVRSEIVTTRRPDEEEAFLWVLARRV